MTGSCPEHGQANTSETLCYVSTLPFQKVCGILSEKARKLGNLTNDKLAFCCTVRHLRTVPTIVIAHTFCASPDTGISYRQLLTYKGIFLRNLKLSGQSRS